MRATTAHLLLLIILALTVGLSLLPLGPWGAALSLGLAALKAAIIALVFMKLLQATPLIRLFAVGGLLWLVFLFAITWSDYLTRGMIGVPGK